MQRNRSSSLSGKRIGFALSAEVLAGVFGVDFEEVVEDDEKHGCRAKEDGETVEIIVGNHLDCEVACDEEFGMDGFAEAT